jgi:hypothetical protein
MNASRAEIEQAIVNTVAYVDSFDYPLTPAEIHRYLIRLPISSGKLFQTLHGGALVPHRLQKSGDFYMLPGRDEVLQVREERRQVAERLWPAAVYYGRWIAGLPFVRMVAVTGSLAVDNVGFPEDIDYFVVTADDHLWICRAFVILIVRWAAQRGLSLCPNYFLSESALRLSTRNLYTAHELTQMVPIDGLEVYHTMRRLNPWTYRFLPNARGVPALPEHVRLALSYDGRPLPGRRLLEAALHTHPGRWADRWEMRRKVRKFHRAYSGWQEAEFSAACCKGHFNQHQRRAIEAYEQLVGESTHVEARPEMSELQTPA